jgi:hypothetical protein
MYIGLDAKHPLFFSDFNETLIFPTFFLNTQLPNFIRIRPVEAELFHADGRKDGQTDMTKLIVAFRNFGNAPKNDNYALLGHYAASSSNFVS